MSPDSTWESDLVILSVDVLVTERVDIMPKIPHCCESSPGVVDSGGGICWRWIISGWISTESAVTMSSALSAVPTRFECVRSTTLSQRLLLPLSLTSDSGTMTSVESLHWSASVVSASSTDRADLDDGKCMVKVMEQVMQRWRHVW